MMMDSEDILTPFCDKYLPDRKTIVHLCLEEFEGGMRLDTSLPFSGMFLCNITSVKSVRKFHAVEVFTMLALIIDTAFSCSVSHPALTRRLYYTLECETDGPDGLRVCMLTEP